MGARVSELGDILRNAREKRQLSLADVSEATRIKEPFLEALENGDYHLLPGQAYVTGFLRNYARCVGLHPDDVVQEFHSTRPQPVPNVRAATRVLASGQTRDYRRRLFMSLGGLTVALVAAFTVKQYADRYAAQASYAPPLNVTPANSGSSNTPSKHKRTTSKVQEFHVGLKPMGPVWVRVTVDGHRRFQGILRPHSGHHTWTGTHTVYVASLDGSLVKATFNGRGVGLLAHKAGLVVDVATPAGMTTAS
jgi:hypothetical protein